MTDAPPRLGELTAPDEREGEETLGDDRKDGVDEMLGDDGRNDGDDEMLGDDGRYDGVDEMLGDEGRYDGVDDQLGDDGRYDGGDATLGEEGDDAIDRRASRSANDGRGSDRGIGLLG